MNRRTFLQSAVTPRQQLGLGVACTVIGGACFGLAIGATLSGDLLVAGIFALNVVSMTVVAVSNLRIVAARLRDE